MNSLPVNAMSLVMVLAGIGIPVMAALNGGLGVRLGNPALAAVLLFGLALLITTTVLLVQPQPLVVDFASVPGYLFLGGLFVAFYVLSVTYIAPRLGVGNAIVLVLLGQLVASAAIDHAGWLGLPQTRMSSTRALGLALMFLGVVLTRR